MGGAWAPRRELAARKLPVSSLELHKSSHQNQDHKIQNVRSVYLGAREGLCSNMVGETVEEAYRERGTKLTFRFDIWKHHTCSTRGADDGQSVKRNHQGVNPIHLEASGGGGAQGESRCQVLIEGFSEIQLSVSREKDAVASIVCSKQVFEFP
jgi:hypothetical protein